LVGLTTAGTEQILVHEPTVSSLVRACLYDSAWHIAQPTYEALPDLRGSRETSQNAIRGGFPHGRDMESRQIHVLVFARREGLTASKGPAMVAASG
jgi:hypothetical protein